MNKFTPGKEGVIFDLPEDVYRKSPGIAQSSLKLMDRSPAHYYSYVNGAKKQSTPAQIFGTLLHSAALEPETLLNKYVVKPDGISFTSKEGKSWRDSQTQTIISKEDCDAFNGCAESINNHPIANSFIQFGKKEVSVFKDSKDSNLLLKGRLDILMMDADNNTAIADVKTCENASEEAFSKDLYNWNYHMQAAYYLDLIGATSFFFIAVEKTAPYAVNVFQLDPDSIDAGRAKYKHLLKKLEECHINNLWPSYGQEIKTIGIPLWAAKKEGLL